MDLDRRSLFLGAALIGALPAAAFAEPAEDEALGRRLADAINDPAPTDTTLRALLSPRSLENRPTAEWLGDLARWRGATGGVAFRTVEPAEGDERVIVLQPRSGGRAVRVTAFVRPQVPDRLSGMYAMPRPARYDGPVPTRAIARDALAVAIDRRVRWAAARDDFSGAVRVVAPDGAVVFEAAHGTSEGRRIAIGDRFHLGSADKSFTALLVARAIDTGRLRWDTRVADVLPDYPNREAAQAITVEHLLSHRAGMGGMFEREKFKTLGRYDRVAQVLPVFAAEPLQFVPGTRAGYSNEGYVLLGAMLEAVEGRAYWDLLAEHVYAPAQMRRSAHLTSAEVPPDKVIGRRYTDEDEFGTGPRVSARDFTGWRGNSCGGGYSTVADMTSYLRALRAGKLGSPETLARMTRPFPEGLPRYGMGFQVRPVGGRTFVGHSGGGPHSGIDGTSMIAWETGWALSVLGNYDAPYAGALAHDLERMVAAQA